MNDLDYLKDINIKEIVTKTHLDESVLKAILERDFEKLKNVNITMNLKILEREYGVNFDEWLKEFNNYKANHFVEDEKGLRVKPKLISYNSVSDKNNYLTYFIYFLIAILIVFGGMFYYFNYMQKNDVATSDNKLENIVVESDKVTDNITDTPTQQQNTTTLQNNEEVKSETNTTIENTLDNNLQTNSDNSIKEPSNEQNLSNQTPNLNNPTSSSTSSDINLNTKEEVKNETTTNEAEKVITKHKLSLIPKDKIWVNVKTLSNGESKNYMIERAVVFEEDSLIFLGNNFFSLELDGVELKLPTNNRYILFKDGEVKFLTQKEYRKLDGTK